MDVTGFENWVNGIFDPLADFVSSIIFFGVTINGATVPLVIVWLILAAVVFTVYFKGLQFWAWGHALELIRGKFGRKTDPGEVSHFQALCSALSGTVGLGNIAGVAIAVTVGGPGATLWMILAGFFAMATKFLECTLGIKYREEHADGSVTGGPFKYLPVAFKRFGDPFSKTMTSVYAVAILCFGIAGGNMFQANQTFAQLKNVTGGDDGALGSDWAALIFGIVLASLTGLVIIGGIKSIGKVTSKLVPGMALMYITICFVVIAFNADGIGTAISTIVTEAFNPQGVAGGALGVMIVGFQRAAFSNEAGLGSAAIAHSAVKTKRPVTEGIVATLEPFFDTVIICTVTAVTIVIVSPQSWLDAREELAAGSGASYDGVVLTSDAFESVSSWFPALLGLAVALFAFSTLLTWSYYTLKAWTTLFGRSVFKERLYQLIFCLFAVLGSVVNMTAVINLADAVLFVCAFVNILALYLLMPEIKKDFVVYWKDRQDEKLVLSEKFDSHSG